MAGIMTMMSGCIGCEANNSAPPQALPQTPAENDNLQMRIDLEQEGVYQDYVSSLAAKDKISISHIFNSKLNRIIMRFDVAEIKKLSNGKYCFSYKLGLRVPFEMVRSGSRDKNLTQSIQYTEAGSNASLTIKPGEPVYLFDSTNIRVKLTLSER